MQERTLSCDFPSERQDGRLKFGLQEGGKPCGVDIGTERGHQVVSGKARGASEGLGTDELVHISMDLETRK